MPLSRNSFFMATVALLVLGFIALASVVTANIWLVQRTQTFARDATDLRRLRNAAIELRSLVQDAEIGQRGYLLTGDERYLTPFEAAIANLDASKQRFLNAAANDPLQQAGVEAPGLISTLQDKMSELSETIALGRRGEREQALEMVRTDRGKDLMDRARTTFQELIGRAEEELSEIAAVQARSATALWWVSVIGGFIVIAATLAGIGTILVYLRQLAEIRLEIQGLNASLEERVRERTAELGRANEEIQRFAYIVTHDLRAPLVNIMGFTAELEQGVAAVQHFVGNYHGDTSDTAYQEAAVAAQSDLPEALGFIRSSTRKMDGLINAILKLSREGRRTLKPERIDLGGLLNAATAVIAHQVADADGEVVTDIQAGAIISDRLSLEQIIGNLLDNAVKYRRTDVPLKVSIRVRMERANTVSISVEDNGRGIQAQDLARVFELFRRSGQQDQPGEGIGLAHVRAMARNLGGDITLNSEFGKGSLFTLSLPADLRAVLGSGKA
ncbi:MAG: CHASE3 domain-containing protein [Chelatococcus sp.]|nr:CHASE3 domain-containing protein [Chelatococcus sp. HY11]MBX3543522.1 CHASE3 domain-containing protein [Chelatococcus sp.]